MTNGELMSRLAPGQRALYCSPAQPLRKGAAVSISARRFDEGV
jgi:hypothetical protein